MSKNTTDSLNNTRDSKRGSSPPKFQSKKRNSKPNEELSKNSVKESINIMSKELQSHFKKLSMKESVNHKTVEKILQSQHEEEEKKQNFFKGKNSILDMDIVQKEEKKSKSPKKRKGSIQPKRRKSELYKPGVLLNASMEGTFHNLSPSVDKKRKMTFYQKQMMHNQKKQYDLEMKRKLLRDEEKEKIQEKPKLTNKTTQIIQERFFYERPIHERTQEVIIRKQNNINNLKRYLLDVEEHEKLLRMQENNMSINYEKTIYNQNEPYGKERMEQFVHKQLEWKKKIENKKERMKDEIERIHTEADMMLYKPTINKTSEILVQLKTQGYNEDYLHTSQNQNQNYNLPTYERLYQQHEMDLDKRQKLYYDNIPNFIPKTNSTKMLKYVKPPIDLQTTERKISDKKKMNKSLTSLGRNNQSFYNEDKFKDHKDSSKFSSGNKYQSKEVSRDLSKELEGYHSPNFNNNYGNLELPPKPQKSEEVSWEKKLANINKKSNSKKDSDPDFFYKLNVRSSSAWDKQKENTVHLDPKFTSIVNNFV
jgi:hypothetical protein